MFHQMFEMGNVVWLAAACCTSLDILYQVHLDDFDAFPDNWKRLIHASLLTLLLVVRNAQWFHLVI